MHPSNQCPFKIRKSELAHVHEPVIYICKFSFMTSTFKVATNLFATMNSEFQPFKLFSNLEFTVANRCWQNSLSSFRTQISSNQTDCGKIPILSLGLLQILQLGIQRHKQIIVAAFQVWAKFNFLFKLRIHRHKQIVATWSHEWKPLVSWIFYSSLNASRLNSKWFSSPHRKQLCTRGQLIPSNLGGIATQGVAIDLRFNTNYISRANCVRAVLGLWASTHRPKVSILSLEMWKS